MVHTELVSQAPFTFFKLCPICSYNIPAYHNRYLILYRYVTNNCPPRSKTSLLNLSNHMEFKKNFNFPQKKKKCFHFISHKHTGIKMYLYMTCISHPPAAYAYFLHTLLQFSMLDPRDQLSK